MTSTKVIIGTGSIVGAALMVACLWVWQQAPHLAADADRPDVVMWAARSAAVAAGGVDTVVHHRVGCHDIGPVMCLRHQAKRQAWGSNIGQ